VNRQEGAIPYQQFSRKVGISDSTLHRLEMGGQNVTLAHLSDRFHCKVSELLGEGERVVEAGM
jgi:hypothetical protein